MPGNQCQLHESTERPCHLQQGVERLKEEERMSAGKTGCSTTRNKSLHVQVYGVCVSCVGRILRLPHLLQTSRII